MKKFNFHLLINFPSLNDCGKEPILDWIHELDYTRDAYHTCMSNAIKFDENARVVKTQYSTICAWC